MGLAEGGAGGGLVGVERRVLGEAEHGEHLVKMRREAEAEHLLRDLAASHEDLDDEGDAAGIQIGHLREVQEDGGDVCFQGLVFSEDGVFREAGDITIKAHDDDVAFLFNLSRGRRYHDLFFAPSVEMNHQAGVTAGWFGTIFDFVH